MRRVLHLDMPRALTTTVRAFDLRAARRLAQKGIELDHADLNTRFWAFALAAGGATVGLEALFTPDREVVSSIKRALEQLDGGALGRMKLGPAGPSFGAPRSSGAIAAAVADPPLAAFLKRWLDSLAPALGLDEEALQVVSLGVESADTLVFACALVPALRERLGERVRIVLGKHSYENFSLSLREEQLKRGDHLRRWFDAIVFHEEQFADTLAAICGGLPARPIAEPGLPPRSYLRSLAVSIDRAPVFMPLSRNRCYFARCAFCVQIERHLPDHRYDDREELDAAMDELVAWADAGATHVVFSDEAVSPALLRRLCDRLEQRPLGLRWSVRVIADTSFDRSLIARMRRSGCAEVLFGLETVSPETAAAMGKVSATATEEAIEALLRAFVAEGIGIFLNFIYAFPTESDAEFERRSFAFWLRMRDVLPGVTPQFNRFGLFDGTAMQRAPERYGLRSVEQLASADDLASTLDYEDRFGRRGNDPWSVEYFAASLGMSPAGLARLAAHRGMAFVEILAQLNYGSFGLLHKAKSGQELVRLVLSGGTSP